jgi:hypothetical protein
VPTGTEALGVLGQKLAQCATYLSFINYEMKKKITNALLAA